MTETDQLEETPADQEDWESCSESDDDDDKEGWIDVHHSSDEEEEVRYLLIWCCLQMYG